MNFPKSLRLDSRSGFTLVEILVVIAIIAILASVFTVAAGLAINAAKRSKANVIASQIQTAILNYQTEYGVYPIPTTTAGDVSYNSTDATDQGPLMIALCGNINAATATATASTVPNTRQIAYLTPKKSDVDPNGILINPFITSTTTPSTYFFIAMDSDYSGILGDSGTAAPGPPDFSTAVSGTAIPAGKPLTQGVAVWACCDPKNITTPTSSTSPQFWVHTY